MKRVWITCLLAVVGLSLWATEESAMVSEFEKLQECYMARHRDVQKEVRHYLATYPYTTYADECYVMSGVCKIERGSFTQGIKDLEKATYGNLYTDFQDDYLFYHGYAYVMVDNFKKATADFQQLAKRKSKYKNKADFYLAYCYYRSGKYNNCLSLFTQIEKDPAYKNTVPYYIVQIYYQQGNDEEVIKRSNAILKSQSDNKHNAELYRILGEIYFKKGNIDNALNNLTKYYKSCKAQKIKPLRYDMYLLGKLFYDKRNYEASIDYFKQVSDQKDTLAEYSRFMLGNAYAKKKQLDKARLSYFSVRELNFTPSIQEEAAYNYVLCSFQSPGPLGESVNAFTEFLKRYPNSRFEGKVYSLLGDALLHSKNYEAALGVLDSIQIKGVKMQDTKQYLRYQIGTEAFVNGRYADAEKWLTEVISRSNSAQKQTIINDAYYWRAEARYRLHKYSACQVDLEKFFSLCKNSKANNYVKAKYLYAYALYMNKDYSKAKRSFEQYISFISREDPSYADVFNRMGDCDFNGRNFSSAIANYKEVIRLQTAGSDYAIFQCGYAQGLLRRYAEKERSMDQLAATYPKSDYADDALYEKARAQIEQHHEKDAIDTYEKLLKIYPKSPYVRKASLESAMLLRNAKEIDEAIKWYKRTVERFPRTEEAYSALADLEAIYVENNNIKEYLAYTKSIQKLNMKVNTQDDSLTYVAAELQYMLGKHKSAINSLSTYLSSYCPGGRYCVVAQYYLADCYYKLKDSVNALNAYMALAQIDGNQYMEEACMRVAELAYDKRDYDLSLKYFYKMQNVASNSQNIDVARLGILRCCYYLNNHEETVNIASIILETPQSKANIKEEAMYNRAKAYVAMKKYKKAIADLKEISKNVKTANGAEATYLLAECYFYGKNLDMAEKIIMDFTQKSTSHRYWLAKSLILLADIYVQKDDIFQAQQYLISLQNNYQADDDIEATISEKLKQIAELESKKGDNAENGK